MIENILSVCSLDYVQETCSPINEILERNIKIKPCPYRFYYEKTGLFYCRWDIENLFGGLKNDRTE